MKTNLTLEEIYKVLTDNYSYLLKKVKLRINYKLKINLYHDEIEELVSDTQLKLLERVILNKITFTDDKKVIGYILFSCWCNYRDANIKQSKKQKEHDKEDWMIEGRTIEESLNKKHNIIALDTLEYTQFKAEPNRNETDADLTDAYYSELYIKLFNYLEDCIADNFFTFKEVGIYKSYILNNWTMKKLIEESDFSRTVCCAAIKKIKSHLKTVDWNIKQHVN